MKYFINQTESELTRLSHTLASHMKRLDFILGKGANKKLKSPKAPQALKPRSSNAIENQLIGLGSSGAGRFLGGRSGSNGSVNALGTSQGQMWSDIASLIRKSTSRDL